MNKAQAAIYDTAPRGLRPLSAADRPNPRKRSRAQAAIYDGILLLLLAALSSTIIFVYVGGTYGQSEDKALRSVYELNYLQSVMKSMYYVDASTLSKITSEGAATYADLDDPATGCKNLGKYPGSISVTDLLKRDLGEGKDDPSIVKLDNKYGTALVPGKTAMQCAMKELMKPFAFAGYRYYVEARDPQGGSNGACEVPLGSASSECNIRVDGKQITNSLNPLVLGTSKPPVIGCDAAAQETTQLLSMSSPFRVLKTGPSATGPMESKIIDYKIRICVWPAANSTS